MVPAVILDESVYYRNVKSILGFKNPILDFPKEMHP